MGSIYNSAGHKVGHIDADGVVWNTADHRVGKVSNDRHILNSENEKVGRIELDGDVFMHEKRIGRIHGGAAFDPNNRRRGHADEPHAEHGAAALLALFD